MKLFVLATAYPDPSGSVASMFIHTRNKYYLQQGHSVTVLNFQAEQGYEMEGIRVLSPAEYAQSDESYDLLLSHAPNLRNHYRFLKKYDSRFPKIIFFFHGHEVLKISDVYPKPFSYVKTRNTFLQDRYDEWKVRRWNAYFQKNKEKIHLIFVSNWLYGKFRHYVSLPESVAASISSVIHNSVAAVFEQQSQDQSVEKEYDFISIRSNMDDAKYGVDIVNDLALRFPQYQFCLIGKGEYFSHFPQAENLTWINRTLAHPEMLTYLNRSRCALMPTREDTQGVMSCEMLTYGLPLITSNIDVCQEIFGEFPNAYLVPNDTTKIDLPEIMERIKNAGLIDKPTRYFAKNTIEKELELFEQMIQ